MIEWEKKPVDEELDDKPYSHLKAQGNNSLGEKSKTPYIIIGVGIIFLIVLFFVLNPKPPQSKYPDIRPLENRMATLEDRINKLEMLKDQVKTIEDQVRLNAAPADQPQLANSVKLNAENIAEIQKRISAIEAEMKAKPEKPVAKAPEERPEPSKKVQESKPAEAPAQPAGDKVYHTVEKGETVYRISQKYGLSVQKLQEMNSLDANTTIHIGQKLIVGPVNKTKQP
jgi:LysM repeat protein